LKSDPDFSIRLGLISAFLLAISPWHISQSRSAMLIGVELFFFASAVWLFLKGLSKPNWWYISSLCFVMAIYSYYGMRVIVPLFILFLLYYWRAEIRQNITAALAGFGIGIICLLPLIGAFITNPDVVFGRAKTVSVFYDQGVALTVWDQIAQDGAKYSPMLTQILHNKPYSYFVDIQRRFMQHFDMRFLFLVGDTQLPFQIPGMGVLYFIDGILLLLGVRNIIRKSPRAWWFLVAWAVVSIIPAALTFITPAANRTFTLVIPLMIVMAYGIVSLFKSVPRWFHMPLRVMIIILYGLHFSYFIYNYTVVLTKAHANWWHYGYQELYSQLHTLESSTQTIAISAKASVPYIFLLWYQQWDPKIAQQQIHHNYQTDEFGFEHVDSVGNYSFPRHFDWEKDNVHLVNNSILVLTPAEKVGSEANLIGHIDYPNKEIAFKIYRITKNE
jgi:4-amino-4-deoxy-L-arabinose transferase-like glycosyltransferase